LNNNRGNNRRRGRGNNRQQGGQQLNRIDSRARGNAPQLLDKYKKLAHDAHLNGDRVQEEYYLQFADHYFRVLADQKQRQEESRQRRDERQQDGSSRSDDPRGRDDNEDDENADGGANREQSRQETRDSREGAKTRSSRDSDGEDDGDGQRNSDYESSENPFVRESRSQRSSTSSRSPRRSARSENDGDKELETGVDPSVLPPSIGSAAEEGVDEEAEAKPRRRTRKPRASDGNDGTLEAVS